MSAVHNSSAGMVSPPQHGRGRWWTGLVTEAWHEALAIPQTGGSSRFVGGIAASALILTEQRIRRMALSDGPVNRACGCRKYRPPWSQPI
jgi:hypothetical protein